MPAKIQAARRTRPGARLRLRLGTNTAGTAQSSGGGVNTGSGVTTGSGRSAGSGRIDGPAEERDAKSTKRTRTVDRKIKSICRGC